VRRELGLRVGAVSKAVPFVLVTVHRASNVDGSEALARILDALGTISRDHVVVFPVHPRTKARIEERGLSSAVKIRLVPPLGYLDLLALERTAMLGVTDSAGVQEATAYLRDPSLTVRAD